jgi:hypothetical protein
MTLREAIIEVRASQHPAAFDAAEALEYLATEATGRALFELSEDGHGAVLSVEGAAHAGVEPDAWHVVPVWGSEATWDINYFGHWVASFTLEVSHECR